MEPIFVAYAALGLMALLPIYVGSRASADAEAKRLHKRASGESSSSDDEAEFFSLEDAKMFPLIGSATLFGLYLLFKFFSKEYINYLLTAYFGAMGVVALVQAKLTFARAITGRPLKGEYRVDMWKGAKEILSYHFGPLHVVFLGTSVAITAFYVVTKHWAVNNLYGEAFSTAAIQLLTLDTFKTGMVLLAGLFFYDIWWVFGTEVMVTVAKNFDAPIKVMWPKDIAAVFAEGFWKTEGLQLTMLGLGDIVIPGIFVALCLRFDYHMALSRRADKTSGVLTDYAKPYFTACFVAYVLGLVATMTVMHTFKAAQPALLYLSPACILSVLITGAVRGELRDVFAYSSNPDSGKDEGSEKTEKKEKKPTRKSSKKDKKSDAEDEATSDGEASGASSSLKRKTSRRLGKKD